LSTSERLIKNYSQGQFPLRGARLTLISHKMQIK
jgi:hypothetical protein